MSHLFASDDQKYWSFSFSISPSSEYSGLISLKIDWFDLLAVQETFSSLDYIVYTPIQNKKVKQNIEFESQCNNLLAGSLLKIT